LFAGVRGVIVGGETGQGEDPVADYLYMYGLVVRDGKSPGSGCAIDTVDTEMTGNQAGELITPHRLTTI
jgi:hypothetical protein